MPRPRREAQLQEPDICEDTVVDIVSVRSARAMLPSPSRTSGVAELFGALADPTRVRLVAALHEREMCVGDIAAAIGLSVSAASHQLRVLRSLDLVRTRRHGRHVYYALDDDHVRTLYRQALDHVDHIGRTTP